MQIIIRNKTIDIHPGDFFLVENSSVRFFSWVSNTYRSLTLKNLKLILAQGKFKRTTDERRTKFIFSYAN